MVSKNKEQARAELQKRQEMIQKGKIPQEMKKYVMPPPKTYTANSARILKDPKNSNNWRVKEPKKASPIKEQVVEKFTQLRTTTNKKTKHDSLSKLEQAMRQLEMAMDGAIDEGGRKEESGVGSDLSDSSIFEYSADESQLVKEEPFNVKQSDKYTDDYLLKLQEFYSLPQQKYFDEFEGVETVKLGAETVTEPKVMNSFTEFDTIKYGMNQQDNYQNFYNEPYDFQNTQSFLYSKTPLFDEPKKVLFNIEEPNTKQSYIFDNMPVQEPETTALEEQDYLLKLLEQTRQDLKLMNFEEQEIEKPVEKPEPLEPNYQEDLIPRSFNLQPISRDQPVIRGRVPIGSLAISDYY